MWKPSLLWVMLQTLGPGGDGGGAGEGGDGGGDGGAGGGDGGGGEGGPCPQTNANSFTRN